MYQLHILSDLFLRSSAERQRIISLGSQFHAYTIPPENAWLLILCLIIFYGQFMT